MSTARSRESFLLTGRKVERADGPRPTAFEDRSSRCEPSGYKCLICNNFFRPSVPSQRRVPTKLQVSSARRLGSRHRSRVGPELLGFFIVLVALPIVSFGFAMHYRGKANTKKRFESVWEILARKRGYVFVPPVGAWPNVTSARVEWEEADGARYRLEAVDREGLVCTRLSARPPALLLGHALVSTSDKNRTLLEAKANDASFDAVFFVRERPRGFAARVVSAEVRRALAAFRMGRYVALRYRRGDLSVVWEEGEENPARIDEARALLAIAAGAVFRAFHGPVSASGRVLGRSPDERPDGS